MTDVTCPRGHTPAAAEETCPEGQMIAAPAMTCPEGHVTPHPAACPEEHVPSRPRGLHPVLRTAALICWAALSGACGDRGGDPVKAAQAFTAAVQRGDMDAVYRQLERAATERLTAAAAQASDQVGGRRRIEPAEMLQIVDVDPNFELASAELLGDGEPPGAEDGAVAQVRLLGSQQESHTLTLVREDGAWRVRIPLPPLTPTTPP
ncbi:hypothetical protein [Nannocystis sp. SCPEA4]|uniref:hypothetical protein n=1 Tax=Nannocystis sp. SCPEA4 TaxID=2996787 RepID=UPI00226EF58C|nr:hypothetical protein [Nannocystis sp. SCPEA4]MCY1057996.1 hypothetical protein [Nannocystis sp. SCPEA4]